MRAEKQYVRPAGRIVRGTELHREHGPAFQARADRIDVHQRITRGPRRERGANAVDSIGIHAASVARMPSPGRSNDLNILNVSAAATVGVRANAGVVTL